MGNIDLVKLIRELWQLENPNLERLQVELKELITKAELDEFFCRFDSLKKNTKIIYEEDTYISQKGKWNKLKNDRNNTLKYEDENIVTQQIRKSLFSLVSLLSLPKD
jgi:hypothetical protein